MTAAAGARPVRSGALLMSVSQVVTAVTGWLTTLVIARLLGPEGVGAYSVALSLLLVLGVVGSLGLENGIAWSVSSGRWAPRSAFVATQVLAALLGAASVAIAVVLRIVAPGAFGGLSLALVAVAAGGLPFLISWQYTRWLAVALDRYEAFVVPPMLVSTLALACCGAGAALWDVEGVVVGLLVAYALTAVVAVLDALRWLPRRDGPSGRAPLREATGFGVRANAAQALQFLNYRVDLFVLSAVVTGNKLGLYATAVSVTSVMFLAPQTLAHIIFPRVAALSAAGEGGREQRSVVEAKSLRHVTLITLISLPIVAGAMALLVPLLYGSDFTGAIVLGLILLPGVALFGVAAVLSATTNGRGHPEYSLRTALIATPPTLVLYAALIPTLDGLGAAVASTLGYALNFAVAAHYYRRATGDRVAPLLIPTRDEIADLRGLVGRGR